MFTADTTRDLNLAARCASKCLKELGLGLTHAKALDLVARLTGKPNHMAAQAGLPDPGLAKPFVLNTYADLQRALSTLTEQQLAMSITVSEGCDANGDAEFFPAASLSRADTGVLWQAADGVLEGNQPVLLFNQAEAQATPVRTASANAGVPAYVVEDLCKILLNKDVSQSLYDNGISDAANDALAMAAPYVCDEVLGEFGRDALQMAYDNHLPGTATFKEFLAGHGNWGLTEAENALTVRLAKALAVPVPAPVHSLSSTDAMRLQTQFELATSVSSSVAREAISEKGLVGAIEALSEKYDVELSLGPWVLASDADSGFWCNDFGWTRSSMAATGFSDAQASIAPTSFGSSARWVKFSEARDYPDQDSK